GPGEPEGTARRVVHALRPGDATDLPRGVAPPATRRGAGAGARQRDARAAADVPGRGEPVVATDHALLRPRLEEEGRTDLLGHQDAIERESPPGVLLHLRTEAVGPGHQRPRREPRLERGAGRVG